MGILLFVGSLALAVGGLVHLTRTDDENVRFFSKFVWSIIIVFVPLLGAIAWFGIGCRWMPVDGVTRTPRRRRGAASTTPPPPVRVETTPEEDEAAIEAEIRYHEQQAEIRRLEALLERKRAEGSGPPISGEPSAKT